MWRKTATFEGLSWAGIPPEKDNGERSLEEPLSFSEEPQVSFGVFSVYDRPTDIRQRYGKSRGGGSDVGATASAGWRSGTPVLK